MKIVVGSRWCELDRSGGNARDNETRRRLRWRKQGGGGGGERIKRLIIGKEGVVRVEE